MQWWYDMLLQGWITKIDAHYAEEDELIWPEQCLTSVIQSSYLKWCMDYKITHPEHSVVIGHQIKDWGINTARPRKDNPHRKLFYLLPSLEQAQAIFSARFSIPPDVWEVH